MPPDYRVYLHENLFISLPMEDTHMSEYDLSRTDLENGVHE